VTFGLHGDAHIQTGMVSHRPSCFFTFPGLASPKGEGTASVLYQYGFDRLHVFADGRTKDRGHTFLTACF
jgi:hypothetical protein